MGCISHVHLGKGMEKTFGKGSFKKNFEDDWTNLLNCTNQISSLPVEPVGNSVRLPVGVRDA